MQCRECQAELPPPKPRGRPRVFCSNLCKKRHYEPLRGRATDEERFAKKYKVVDGHWIWQGSTASGLYGMFYRDGAMRPAHRVAYELFVGPIPEGLVLDHLCNVKRCVRPSHLEPVTSSENRRRSRRGLERCACACCHH